jgi:hypothetical protein
MGWRLGSGHRRRPARARCPKTPQRARAAPPSPRPTRRSSSGSLPRGGCRAWWERRGATCEPSHSHGLTPVPGFPTPSAVWREVCSGAHVSLLRASDGLRWPQMASDALGWPLKASDCSSSSTIRRAEQVVIRHARCKPDVLPPSRSADPTRERTIRTVHNCCNWHPHASAERQ